MEKGKKRANRHKSTAGAKWIECRGTLEGCRGTCPHSYSDKIATGKIVSLLSRPYNTGWQNFINLLAQKANRHIPNHFWVLNPKKIFIFKSQFDFAQFAVFPAESAIFCGFCNKKYKEMRYGQSDFFNWKNIILRS